MNPQHAHVHDDDRGEETTPLQQQVCQQYACHLLTR